MKSLVIVCVLAAALGGAIVGCGPQKPYCVANNGPCFVTIDAGPPDIPDAGPGESIIIGQQTLPQPQPDPVPAN